MAVLIAPNDQIMVRELPDGFTRTSPSRWHFMRKPGRMMTVCNHVIPGYLKFETAPVSRVNINDICHECWPYGGNNDTQERML